MDLNILIFDVLLGMIIVLLAKSGASRAYGAWASKRIKAASRQPANSEL